MKLLTYRRSDGTVAHGALTEDETTISEWGDGDLSAVVTSGTTAASDSSTAIPLTAVTVLPPLFRPGKIICAASNYQAHITEGGGGLVDKTRTSPKLFNKFDTAIIGPDEPFVLPEISTTVDWEVEIAVIIGSEARGVSVDNALDHVFGYATANDISLRKLDAIGYERDFDNPMVGFFDWLEGKWADGSAPIGPYLVTADEVPDPQALPISLTVNGEIKQEATTAGMIFSCAELIAFASRLCTLKPGDLILTGTPAGVGATTGTYLQSGDEMVAEVGDLGRLRTPVV